MSQTFVQAKIAGCYVPEFVRRALRTTFPNVDLAWNYHYRRWVLIQRLTDGSWESFRMLGTPMCYEAPTMRNTVQHVARLDRIRTKLDAQRFLEQLDATNPAVEVEKRSRESLREGVKEMVRHVIVPRTTVRIPWRTKTQ